MRAEQDQLLKRVLMKAQQRMSFDWCDHDDLRYTSWSAKFIPPYSFFAVYTTKEIEHPQFCFKPGPDNNKNIKKRIIQFCAIDRKYARTYLIFLWFVLIYTKEYIQVIRFILT